jgi:hypothetical protein
MSPDAWAFAGLVTTTAGGWVTLLLQNRRQHAENRAANQTLVERSAQLVPNGNKPIDQGGTIADSLGRLEGDVGGLRADISAVQASFLAHLIQHGGGQQ